MQGEQRAVAGAAAWTAEVVSEVRLMSVFEAGWQTLETGVERSGVLIEAGWQ